jgi:glycine C-acetyltransferase
MNSSFKDHVSTQLDAIRAAGTYKREQVLSTSQGTLVRANGGAAVLNMCANKRIGIRFSPLGTNSSARTRERLSINCRWQ